MRKDTSALHIGYREMEAKEGLLCACALVTAGKKCPYHMPLPLHMAGECKAQTTEKTKWDRDKISP